MRSHLHRFRKRYSELFRLEVAQTVANSEEVDEEIASELSDFRLRKMEQAKADGAYREDPQAWIERLLQLHEAGNVEDLSEELGEFREQYPDFSLPDSLQAYDPTGE